MNALLLWFLVFVPSALTRQGIVAFFAALLYIMWMKEPSNLIYVACSGMACGVFYVENEWFRTRKGIALDLTYLGGFVIALAGVISIYVQHFEEALLFAPAFYYALYLVFEQRVKGFF